MKCTEIIIQDHKILRRGLDILDMMVSKVEEGEWIEIADIRTMLKFLRLFGDEYLLTMEERVLFPALIRAVPQEGTLRQILLEHNEERTLVEAIETALNPKKGIDFVRSSRKLIALLRSHMDREEDFFCHRAKRLLSKEEDEMIAAEFTRNQTQSETYGNFARLERKYRPKPRETRTNRELHA